MYAVCYYWRSVTFMPTIDFTGIILPQFFRDSPLPVSFTLNNDFVFRLAR